MNLNFIIKNKINLTIPYTRHCPITGSYIDSDLSSAATKLSNQDVVDS